MTRASTTVRLGLLVFGFQVATAAALVIGLGGYARWQTTARTDNAVQLVRDDLLTVYAREGAAGLARTIDERRRLRTPGAIILLADRGYARLAGTPMAWPHALTRDGRVRDAILVDVDGITPVAARARVSTLPGGLHLLTAVKAQGEALAVIAEASAAALLIAVVLALATAWVSARMFDAQLAEPVGALRAARRNDLSHRVDDHGAGDAFAMLGREVNAALTHIEALVAQSRFATDAMAHDLKSPITRMRASLDRVERLVGALPDTGEVRAAVDQAQEESGRLLSVVDTALSISRAEAGIDRDSFRPVDLPALLEDMAEIYGPLVEDAGRVILVGAAAPMAPYPVHRELLGQAIGNLIDNSLKYGAGAIRITLGRTGRAVTIGVADEGPGIGPADRALALRKFGRLDTARSSAGAGLGLALVAAVAHLHGGAIRLDDAGPGLAVSISLPDLDP